VRRAPAFEGPARRRAVRALADAVEQFGRAGYRSVASPDPLEARLESRTGGLRIRLDVVRQGRVFGGTYALEISTGAVLPKTRGLTARGRGLVRLQGVAFRAKRGDEDGRRVAARLTADPALSAALADVHFERIRVEPDGRPVIRHMGGSVVWVAFPPLVKQIPLVPDQARATAAALGALAAAGTRSRSA